MLRDEGNENGEKKTTIGLISKKASLHVQHTHIFATWDFQKLSSYMFYGGNVVLVQLFSTHFYFGDR